MSAGGDGVEMAANRRDFESMSLASKSLLQCVVIRANSIKRDPGCGKPTCGDLRGLLVREGPWFIAITGLRGRK